MKLFRRGYEMTLNRVFDTVTIREGNEKLTLTVNGDAMHMVAGLNVAQKRMAELTNDTPDEDVRAVAEYFAAVIFGNEQATQLMAFYGNDPACVINLCGQYFKDRLAGLISAAQKKLKDAQTL